jgi:hypothetical protein
MCIALYRPKEGGDEKLRELISRHVPTLRERGFATDRPVTLLRCRSDGTYLEIFEWVDGEAAGKAHEDEKIGPLWGAMAEVAEFAPLNTMKESEHQFPHFEPVDGLVS